MYYISREERSIKKIMAIAVKNTPVLEEKSSERFNKLINSQKNDKISEEEKKRIKELVEKVMSNSKK